MKALRGGSGTLRIFPDTQRQPNGPSWRSIADRDDPDEAAELALSSYPPGAYCSFIAASPQPDDVGLLTCQYPGFPAPTDSSARSATQEKKSPSSYPVWMLFGKSMFATVARDTMCSIARHNNTMPSYVARHRTAGKPRADMLCKGLARWQRTTAADPRSSVPEPKEGYWAVDSKWLDWEKAERRSIITASYTDPLPEITMRLQGNHPSDPGVTLATSLYSTSYRLFATLADPPSATLDRQPLHLPLVGSCPWRPPIYFAVCFTRCMHTPAIRQFYSH